MALDFRAIEAAHAEPREEALARIAAFVERFSLAHFDLACHAAAPLTLTPDLLYQLWAQFSPPDTPWTAVADVLLSTLCQDAGHETYRMGPTTRQILLAQLSQRHASDAPNRLQDLTDFLWMAAEQQAAQANSHRARSRAQAERVNALALSDPDDAQAEFLALADERLAEPHGRSLSTTSLNLLNLLNQLPGGIAGRKDEVLGQLPEAVQVEMGVRAGVDTTEVEASAPTIRYINVDVQFTSHTWLSNGEESLRADLIVDGKPRGGFTERLAAEHRQWARDFLDSRGTDLQQLGVALARIIFPEGARRDVLRKVYSGLQPHERLRLRISGPAPVQSLPWECIYFEQPDLLSFPLQFPMKSLDSLQNIQGFVSLNSRISIVRYQPSEDAQRAWDLPKPDTVRLISLYSRLAQETQVLQAVAKDAAQFQFDAMEITNAREFNELVRILEPHILNLAADGGFESVAHTKGGDATREGVLGLAEGQRISGSQLASILRECDVQLAVLLGGYTARHDERDLKTGIAPTLNEFIPAVVGMQTLGTDTASVIFSEAFYRALATGAPVDAAMTEARIALATQAGQGSVDWAVPGLYLGVDGDVAFLPRTAAQTNLPTDTKTNDLHRAEYLRALQILVSRHFNNDELKLLCFDLGAEFENIPGRSKGAKIKGIVEYFERRGQLDNLVAFCRKERSMSEWPNPPSPAPTEPGPSLQYLEQDMAQMMSQAFNREELRVLCADFGIRPGLIRFDSTQNAAPDIWEQCKIEGKLSQLMNWCKKERPNYAWPDLIDALPIEDNDTETRRYLTELRSYLMQRFNKPEFRELAFAAGADVAGLNWSRGKEIIVLEVIQQLKEQGKVGSLVHQAAHERKSFPPNPLPLFIPPNNTDEIARIDRRLRLLNDALRWYSSEELHAFCLAVECDISDIALSGSDSENSETLAQRLIYWADNVDNWAKLKTSLEVTKPDTNWDQFALPVSEDKTLESLQLSKQLREALSRLGVHNANDLLDLGAISLSGEKDRQRLPAWFDKKLERELMTKLRASGWLEESTRRSTHSAKSKIRAATRKK